MVDGAFELHAHPSCAVRVGFLYLRSAVDVHPQVLVLFLRANRERRERARARERERERERGRGRGERRERLCTC